MAPLPLPGEIVTTALSPVATRAHGSYGRWVGNEEREVWKARKHGELVVLRAEGGTVYVRGVHGPRVCELGPRSGRATGNTFFRRPPRCGSHPPSHVLDALPHWQWVVSTRH